VNESILMAKPASFIGETSFIGEKYILLAKQNSILAKNQLYWRLGNSGAFFPNFIGDHIKAVFASIVVFRTKLSSHKYLGFVLFSMRFLNKEFI
jgi:hypothetical protein